MKVVNGKLLGQPIHYLDTFHQKIEQRCDRLEDSLSTEQRQQISIYEQGLIEIYDLHRSLGEQIRTLENNQLIYLKRNGIVKESKPRLIWIGCFGFVAISLIFLFSWYKFDFKPQCNPIQEPANTSVLPDLKAKEDSY